MNTPKRKKAPIEAWGSYHIKTGECPDGLFPGKPWPGAVPADGYRIVRLVESPASSDLKRECARMRAAVRRNAYWILAFAKSGKTGCVQQQTKDMLEEIKPRHAALKNPRRTTKPRKEAR